VSIIGIVVSKYYQDEVSEQFDVSKCGGITETLTMALALEDEAKPLDRRVGLMNCFCYNQFLKIALDVRDLEFTLIDGSKKKFCGDWLAGYTLSNAIV
jgi:L-alanine-DL-glutamate epimerase-like enolase superfamily enzyme